MSNFNFEKWFNSLKTDGVIYEEKDFNVCLKKLHNDKLDISCFKTSYDLTIDKTSNLRKDNNGKYFIDFRLPRSGQITTGYLINSENSSDIKMTLHVNDTNFIPLNEGVKIVDMCAIYSELKIRLTFNTYPFSVKINYLSYILRKISKNAEYLGKNPFILDGILYVGGVTVMIDDFVKANFNTFIPKIARHLFTS